MGQPKMLLSSRPKHGHHGPWKFFYSKLHPESAQSAGYTHYKTTPANKWTLRETQPHLGRHDVDVREFRSKKLGLYLTLNYVRLQHFTSRIYRENSILSIIQTRSYPTPRSWVFSKEQPAPNKRSFRSTWSHNSQTSGSKESCTPKTTPNPSTPESKIRRLTERSAIPRKRPRTGLQTFRENREIRKITT